MQLVVIKCLGSSSWSSSVVIVQIFLIPFASGRDSRQKRRAAKIEGLSLFFLGSFFPFLFFFFPEVSVGVKVTKKEVEGCNC